LKSLKLLACAYFAMPEGLSLTDVPEAFLAALVAVVK
tara:strand:+ start:765 stop:875 length:111 start_codon:yes stop_codon:yes gene_type:complete